MIRSMGIDRGRVGAERVAEERSSGAPAGGDWNGTAQVSQCILSLTREGDPEIHLQTAEVRGGGVASLIFHAGFEGSSVSMTTSGTGAWPSAGSLVWYLPPTAFDAVVAILRDGESPTLYAFTREGELHCSLAAEIKTRAAT
jgi:hypothetical protein